MFQYFSRMPESSQRDTETDIPTQFNLPSKKPLLTAEQVKAFYQATTSFSEQNWKGTPMMVVEKTEYIFGKAIFM